MTDIEQLVDEDAPGFHLFAKLGVSIDKLAAQLERVNNREQARLRLVPRYIGLERMSTAATQAGNADVLDFGGPEDGLIWTVRILLSVQSPDPTVTNAANVVWHIGQKGAITATTARVLHIGLPKQSDYGDERIVLRSNQNLLANITAIPASPNNNIVCIAVITEEPLWAAAYTVTTM